MFALPVMAVVTAIMAVIQISIWKAFPKGFRDIMFANPVFAFLLNLFGSGMITVFTGIASFVGLCNLGASVVFGIYAYWYKKKNKLDGLTISWLRVMWIIPVFPLLKVKKLP